MSSSNQRPANRGFRSVLRCAISHYRQFPSCLHQNPTEDLTAIRSSATALPVERIDEGRLPALLAPDPDAERRVIESSSPPISGTRTPSTPTPSPRVGSPPWAERHGIVHLRQVEPVHVATYVGIC